MISDDLGLIYMLICRQTYPVKSAQMIIDDLRFQVRIVLK